MSAMHQNYYQQRVIVQRKTYFYFRKTKTHILCTQKITILIHSNIYITHKDLYNAIF